VIKRKQDEWRGKMIDLPMNAEVYCSDGIAGRSTYTIGNPVNHRITHLVVKSYRPPFREYLVPVDQVEETTDDRIKLKGTREDLKKMDPFVVEDSLRTELPAYEAFANTPAIPEVTTQVVTTYIPVQRQNIPQDEVALRRGARVEATDGYVGQVDELLIDSKDMRVTHLVLLVRHIFEGREITIPVSQIDHIDQGTIYLKLDRQSVRELPTTPIQRWSR
jgi:sporulation protein YlmC with PRC-barrel domain